MKTKLIWLSFFLASCASVQKPGTDDAKVLNLYNRPFRIFSVGYWPGGYMILTLKDVNDQYFTIKTPLDTNLKVGLVYNH